MTERPLVKVMALVRRTDGSILVSEGVNNGGRRFHRPLGGTVEQGELAAVAIEREFMEELSIELRVLGLVTVLENLFDMDGRQFHEIVILLEAEFIDPALYSWESFPRHDHADATTTVVWRSHGATEPPLFPTGVEAHV